MRVAIARVAALFPSRKTKRLLFEKNVIKYQGLCLALVGNQGIKENQK